MDDILVIIRSEMNLNDIHYPLSSSHSEIRTCSSHLDDKKTSQKLTSIEGKKIIRGASLDNGHIPFKLWQNAIGGRRLCIAIQEKKVCYMERTMRSLSGKWHPVWWKKQNCRMKFTWYLNVLDKVPFLPYRAYQVKEHVVCILYRLLKMAVNEV